MRIDYIVSNDLLNKIFDFRILPRDFDGILAFFTDHLKISGSVDYCIIVKSYRLPDHCSVFQSEIVITLKAAQCLLGDGNFLKKFPDLLGQSSYD